MLQLDNKMKQDEIINQAIDYIEARLFETINSDDVAKHIGMSETAFGEAFKSLTGYTATEYIRNRRLFEAAILLVQTDEKIIDIGLRCGFESHDSFTRAFTKFHGLKPSRVRKKKTGYRKFSKIQVECLIRGGDTENGLKVLHKFETGFVGYKRFISKENEEYELKSFWKDFYDKYQNISENQKELSIIKKTININAVGEYGIRLGDLENGFQYMIAGRFSGGEIPLEMTVETIPESDWAVFDYSGYDKKYFDRSDIVHNVEKTNDNTQFERAGDFVVEWYEELGSHKEYGRKAIWIPVMERGNWEKDDKKKIMARLATKLIIFAVIFLLFIKLANLRFANDIIEDDSTYDSLIINNLHRPFWVEDKVNLKDYESQYSIEYDGIVYEFIDEFSVTFDYSTCTLGRKIDNVRVKSTLLGKNGFHYSSVYEIDGIDRKIAVMVNFENKDIFLVFINNEYKNMDWNELINMLKKIQ